MSMLKAIAVLLMSTLGICAFAADDDGITPYRPSVSNPAQLPLAGQIEFELGGISARNGDARRDGLPYLFKLAFNKQWGVLLGGDAYVSERDASGSRVRGIGDTAVTLKRAFVMDDEMAYGLEFGLKLPTAKEATGSGKADYTLNGIFSKDFGKLHMDANLNFTRLGEADAGTSRAQTGLSAAFSLPVADKWSAIAELSGVRHNGEAGTSQLLTALAYSPSKWLTFDVGIAKGLTSASQDWSVFTGVVMPIARLWQ
jgi:hypothetical protein